MNSNVCYGHLRKLGEKFGIVEKAMDEAEHEIYDTRNENLPDGSDAWIL